MIVEHNLCFYYYYYYYYNTKGLATLINVLALEEGNSGWKRSQGKHWAVGMWVLSLNNTGCQSQQTKLTFLPGALCLLMYEWKSWVYDRLNNDPFMSSPDDLNIVWYSMSSALCNLGFQGILPLLVSRSKTTGWLSMVDCSRLPVYGNKAGWFTPPARSCPNATKKV
jgi:hypothetical protein